MTSRRRRFNTLSIGRKKTSSVHPGGVRMSIHEAPVFSESSMFDNVRMVSDKVVVLRRIIKLFI